MRRFLAVAMLAASAMAAQAAVYTVTTNADDGAGSLRDAVAQANLNPGADTINFAVTGTIALTTGLIRIESGPLTIVGPGAANLTIDGNANGRIFAVLDGATLPACPALSGPSDYLVTISGLTLQNASRNVANSSGGAIISLKSLVLDAMVIRDSAAKNGGGVSYLAQYPGQFLAISNSQFINNSAKPTVVGNTGAHNGGALFAADNCAGIQSATTISIDNSEFHGNRVQPGPLQGVGGAISIIDNATVTIARTRVYNNGIDLPNPPGAFSYPGGGIRTTATSVTITDSEISDNYAQNSGGISINADNASLQTPGDTFQFRLVNSTISGNLAFGSGGASVIWGNVAVEIFNSTIADNLSVAFGSSGILLSRPAGAYLDPTVALVSSVLGQARQNKGDLSADIAVLPATTVNATNSLVQRVCSTCNITVTGTGNAIGTAPLLGPLAFNGAPTRTMAMLGGSPVIDTGSNPLGLTNDQRGPGFPRTIGAATDMGAQEGPGFCAGFTDILSTNAFCPNAEWMKNRAITFGCTSTSVYCPANSVTRLQMAAFMNRLGVALTPQKRFVEASPGAFLMADITGPANFVCASTDVPAATYPRAAVVNVSLSGLADANAIAWRGFIAFSTNGGVSWQVTPNNFATRASSPGNQWSNTALSSQITVAPGTPYRFALGLRRDNIIAGTTGNFVQSFCQLDAVVGNVNGSVPPFDSQTALDGTRW